MLFLKISSSLQDIEKGQRKHIFIAELEKDD
jgi:hypothetical protein